MNYFPNYYNPMQQVQQVPQNNGICWVQGEQGAKSYLVAPNSTALLMDSECQKFYIKSSDPSGMPLPLRTFSFHEIVGKQAPAQEQAIDSSSYVTRAEFDEIKGKLDELLKGDKDDE